MKRLFALIVAMLYTLSSIGMTVSTHYCAGKAMTCKCAKPKDNKKKDHCCKDTVKYLKSQDAHQFQEAGDLKKYHAIAVAVPTSFYTVDLNKELYNLPLTYFSTGVANLNGPPLYELFCDYRV